MHQLNNGEANVQLLQLCRHVDKHTACVICVICKRVLNMFDKLGYGNLLLAIYILKYILEEMKDKDWKQLIEKINYNDTFTTFFASVTLNNFSLHLA